MHRIKYYKSVESGGGGILMIKNGLSVLLKSPQKGLPSHQADPLLVEKLVSDVGVSGFSSAATMGSRRFFNTGGGGGITTESLVKRDIFRAGDIPILFRGRQTRECVGSLVPHQCNKSHMLPYFARPLSSSSASQSSGQTPRQQNRKDISTVDDPFDAPTYNIPEKPVTFTEGASYSVIILAGLGIAAAAGYAVFKELIFEPREYKIFGKALERVQNDSQVRVRIGSPITGYGQESRNRAARQRIPHRTWTDQDGNEHVEVNFIVRGPHGGGKVYSEMFKDKTDKQWKFTFLIVEITSPSHSQLLLESYVPA